jgi:hypothetical protein
MVPSQGGTIEDDNIFGEGADEVGSQSRVKEYYLGSHFGGTGILNKQCE